MNNSTYTSTFVDSAERIFNQIAKHSKVAVFIQGGRVVIAGATSKYYGKVTKRESSNLIGIYDDRCTLAQMIDDLRWAEQKMWQ